MLLNPTKPSIIILDNARYYLALGAKYQDRVLSTLFFLGKGILFDPRMLAVELKQLVRKHFADYKKLEIICLVELAGHKVLFSPPYYSDLQPIELA